MQITPRLRVPKRIRIDWRGWIALTWALRWGWAYALMVIQARSPQILSLLRQIRNSMSL